MQAVVVEQPGPPSVLELVERVPPAPGPGEVAVDVAYAGVGLVDTLFRRGDFGLPTPFVPGIEVTGTVRALGDGVDRLRVGQPVAAMLNDFGRASRAGGYAEVAVAHESMTAAVPGGVDLARVAGAVVNGVTAYVALHDVAGAGPDDRVLVLGASGGLGGSCVRLARAMPCRDVVGVVSRDRARAPDGCTEVVLTEELDRWLAEGDGVDVVLDGVGGPARRAAFDALAPGGRHVVLGNASGEDLALSTDAVWHGSRTVSGLSLGGVAHLRPDRVRMALEAVVSLVARGVVEEPPPVVRPMSEVRDVHQEYADRVAPPKTVLIPGR